MLFHLVGQSCVSLLTGIPTLFCLSTKAAVATVLCLKWPTSFRRRKSSPSLTHNWIQCAAQLVLSQPNSAFIRREKASMLLPWSWTAATTLSQSTQKFVKISWTFSEMLWAVWFSGNTLFGAQMFLDPSQVRKMSGYCNVSLGSNAGPNICTHCNMLRLFKYLHQFSFSSSILFCEVFCHKHSRRSSIAWLKIINPQINQAFKSISFYCSSWPQAYQKWTYRAWM